MNKTRKNRAGQFSAEYAALIGMVLLALAVVSHYVSKVIATRIKRQADAYAAGGAIVDFKNQGSSTSNTNWTGNATKGTISTDSTTPSSSLTGY